MSVYLARLAPAIEIGPAPSDGAWSKVNWRREGAVRDQAIDGRAAEPSGLDDGRHAREKACRFGGGAPFQGCGAHADAQSVVSSVVELGRWLGDDFPRGIVALSTQCRCRGSTHGAGIELESSIVAWQLPVRSSPATLRRRAAIAPKTVRSTAGNGQQRTPQCGPALQSSSWRADRLPWPRLASHLQIGVVGTPW
jgi:hypothetical protein